MEKIRRSYYFIFYLYLPVSVPQERHEMNLTILSKIIGMPFFYSSAFIRNYTEYSHRLQCMLFCNYSALSRTNGGNSPCIEQPQCLAGVAARGLAADAA